MSKTATAGAKYPVFIRFIVQSKHSEKFNEAMNQLIVKHDIENVKLVSVHNNAEIDEENVCVWRLDVPTSVKKEAEKYLHFAHDIFVKLGVDFYPAYIENPQVRN